MKKLSSLLLSLIVVFMLATNVFAQGTTATPVQIKSLYLNDEQVSLAKQSIIVEGDVIYLPVRAVLEKLDFKVKWNKENSTVVSDKYGNDILFKINEEVAQRNGFTMELTEAPKVINGTTYISLTALQTVLPVYAELDEAQNGLYLYYEAAEGFFWKVEHEGSTVYLLGSIHVGDLSLFPLRVEVEEAYLESDYVGVEVDTIAPMSEAQMKEVESKQLYTGGETLKDNISPELYERLDQVAVAVGLPAGFFDPYEPWVVSQTLLMIQAQLGGAVQGLGIESYFVTKAIEDEKPIVELETLMSQINMFDSFSEEYQLEELNAQIEVIEKLLAGETVSESNQVTALLDVWKAGDNEVMVEILEGVKESPEYYEKMFLNRHPGMLEKIEGYLKDGKENTYFIIVGAFHFFGEDGLVSLLEKEGYKVDEVN